MIEDPHPEITYHALAQQISHVDEEILCHPMYDQDPDKQHHHFQETVKICNSNVLVYDPVDQPWLDRSQWCEHDGKYTAKDQYSAIRLCETDQSDKYVPVKLLLFFRQNREASVTNAKCVGLRVIDTSQR